jgi:molecular chaperone Hsp33
VLLSLGKDELYDIIKTEGKVSLHCHFCNKDYVYDKEQIDKLTESSDEK